jgi:hypothetical protein
VAFGSAKSEARRILQLRDRDALLTWGAGTRGSLRAVISLTFDADELVCWRAIEASGWLAATYDGRNRAKLQDTLRRQLWLMNDESGGLGWHAPEIIGEILVNVPSLIGEYITVLPSYIKEEPFERGTHHAICRLASVHPARMPSDMSAMHSSLTATDPYVRCFAALTLLAIGDQSKKRQIATLSEDQTPLRLYDFTSGEFRQTTLADDLARAIT